jgi:hypothetical protein
MTNENRKNHQDLTSFRASINCPLSQDLVCVLIKRKYTSLTTAQFNTLIINGFGYDKFQTILMGENRKNHQDLTSFRASINCPLSQDLVCVVLWNLYGRREVNR